MVLPAVRFDRRNLSRLHGATLFHILFFLPNLRAIAQEYDLSVQLRSDALSMHMALSRLFPKVWRMPHQLVSALSSDCMAHSCPAWSMPCWEHQDNSPLAQLL